jgi:hypothetical protein
MDFPTLSDEDILHYQDAVREAIKLAASTRDVLGEDPTGLNLTFSGVQIAIAGNPGVKEYRVTIVPGP